MTGWLSRDRVYLRYGAFVTPSAAVAPHNRRGQKDQWLFAESENSYIPRLLNMPHS